MNKASQTFEDRDDVCITCLDAAVPVRLIELIDDNLARVDAGGCIEVVSVALVAAKAGDVILVQAKEAIAKLEE